MNEKRALHDNVMEYFSDAQSAFKAGHFNSAVTLYFKTLASMADLYLFTNDGITPSNHAERFRLLEAYYPEVYKMLDKTFPVYQESYKLRLDEKPAEFIRGEILELAKLLNFEEIVKALSETA